MTVTFRHLQNAAPEGWPGQQPLGLGDGGGRDGLLIVPRTTAPESAAPLAVLLHGAGGSARRVTSLFGVAEELGIIVLAPESRERHVGRDPRQTSGPTSTF